MRRAGSAFLLAALSCTAPAPSASSERFEVDGRPIHPACLLELIGWISDSDPVVSAVDVEGSVRSNRYSGGRVTKLTEGWEYRNPDKEGEGFFDYRWLGISPRGTHVVLTAENGGGSGIFYRILFLRLEVRPFFNHDHEERRWVLSCLGEVGMGDRTRDEAHLEQETLVIRSPEGQERRIPVPAP